MEKSSRTYLTAKLKQIMKKLKRIELGQAQSATEKKYEWFRDNCFLLQKTCTGLMSVFLHTDELPEDSHRYPRIYSYAAEYCRIAKNRIVQSELERYWKTVGESESLSSGEVLLFPDMFRLFLLEEVTLISEKTEAEIENIIRSLRFFSNYHPRDLFRLLSQNETLLEKDPYYRQCDRETKDLYRHRITLLARKQRKTERQIIVELLKKSRAESSSPRNHIGYYLFQEQKNYFYFPCLFFLIIAGILLVGIGTGQWITTVLSVIPLWEIAKFFVDFLFSKAKSAHLYPRIKITEKNCPLTLLTVITVIRNRKDADALLKKIEQYAYAHPLNGIHVGFLADFPASDISLSEEEKELCCYLKQRLQEKNKTFQGRLFGAIRRRLPNAEQGNFSARERKRGAICDFLEATAGGRTEEFLLLTGQIEGAKYFAALDSDTRPLLRSVEQLIGVLEHPLAQPVYHSKQKRIIHGYGIAAPRIDVTLDSVNRNGFTRILGGFGGVELYGNPSFNIYQDLFSEGIFAGKGLIRISCFRQAITGLFPQNTVLSHDILEGNLLRSVYVSDVAFCDGIPQSILSYQERNHRWIRGDWQNIRYLNKTIRLPDGHKINNPMNGLSKFKLFDNLRRSLTYPAILACILAAPWLGASLFWIGLSALWGNTALFILQYLFHAVSLHTVRYRSKIWPELGRSLINSVLTLLCLPYFSISSLDAILRALYRQVTKKRLLEWTTAAQSDKNLRGTPGEYFRKMLGQLLGVVFLFSFPYTVLGILWLLTPLFCYLLESKERKRSFIPPIDAEMQLIWNYFARFLNQKNNWLPPDNYQETPLGIEAPRTSPTNIGLAMLSCLGAYDLNYISREKLLELLSHMLDTLERLETWNGQPYNWYSTITLSPLSPRYISTVDNGNFAALLYALAEGLNEISGAEALVVRIRTLLSTLDFSLLYDVQKDLFRIGYDAEANQYSESYYDLYVSEARLTSFYAIATGQVPLRHWRQLSRLMTRQNGYFCIKSWSGTMFEYFMPHLLLPAYEGALSGETLRSALQEQKQAAVDGIWGISESGYYAFDAQMNYQYKAFGVPSLALKTPEAEDKVISPYSTFLTLPFFPKAAMKNLQAMKQFPLSGKYGFYEAVDFSPSRTGRRPCVVQSYMVHHLGMSFLAGINALLENRMQKRFMSSQMAAYAELLQEKLPQHILKYDPPQIRQEQRERYAGGVKEYTAINPYTPNVVALSNRNSVEILTDSGCGVLQYRGNDISRYLDAPLYPEGIFSFLHWGKETLGTTFAPIYDNSAIYRSYFEEGQAVFFARKAELETRLSVMMHPLQDLSLRELVIKNNSSSQKKVQFLFYFRPVLMLRGAYEAHPTFRDLFLEAEFCSEQNSLLYRRRKRSPEEPSLWLGVQLSVPFEFEVSTDQVLARRETPGLAAEKIFFRNFRNTALAPIQPCVARPGEVSVRGRGTQTLQLKCAMGASKQQVLETLRLPKTEQYEDLANAAKERSLSVYRALKLNKEDKLTYDILLSGLCYRNRNSAVPVRYRNTLGLERLWGFGISGDVPILLLKADEENLARCIPFLQAFRLMKHQHLSNEMVLIFSEGGSYERPIYRQLEHLLQMSGLSGWQNQKEGIHLVNIQNLEDFTLLYSVSRFYVDLKLGWKLKYKRTPFRKKTIYSVSGKKLNYCYKTGVGGFLECGGFGIDDKDRVPSRHPWTHILSNPQFGTVLTDSSLGFTYAFNSYQNRLTPWYNDIIEERSGESLFLWDGNRRFDLIQNASVQFRRGVAVYSARTANITAETTVFVPQKHLAKVLRVHIKNPTGRTLECRYDAEIILGTRQEPQTVFRESCDGCLFFTNALNTLYAQGCCCLFGAGDIAVSGAGLTGRVPPGKECDFYFVLGYARSKKQAHSLIFLLSSRARLEHELLKILSPECPENSIRLNSVNQPLNLLYNNFLPEQILRARLQARTGFYQCSGAFGFRDQLQDAMCFSILDPSHLKRQLIKAAAHQFLEGDVMHWWHENMHRNDNRCGVRTRSSDDLLWLPLALCEYTEKAGDRTLLRKKVSYLHAEPLRPGEEERYLCAQPTEEKETLYQHGLRALRQGLRFGEHGLLLFGGGDWNDGMNRIGLQGKGESVWVSMFAVLVLERFAILAEEENDPISAVECRKNAVALRTALEEFAWDGEWYLRGFFDNGQILGGKECEECRIDLIVQSFSALIGLRRARVEASLAAVWEFLETPKHGLVKLFTPPFRDSPNNPGYIMGYIAGVRENGGQYTHAAIWYVFALYAVGQYDRAFEILNQINPVSHSQTPTDVGVYRVEPYAICADIYTAEGAEGRGGWSQYTGAAGWYFKAVTEELLGLKKQGDQLQIHPKLPSFWNGCEATLTLAGTPLSLEIRRGEGSGLFCDGQICSNVPLNGIPHQILAII